MTLFKFLTTCDNLKRVLRTGWLLRGVPPSIAENVSSHSHSTAILTHFLAHQIDEPVDHARLLLMALIHDLPEAEIGDIPISAQRADPAFQQAKQRAENQAMQTIIEALPESLRQQIADAWTEYYEGTTLEARLVEAADRLSTAVHAAQLVKRGYPTELFTTFIDHAESKIKELNISQANEVVKEIREIIRT